MKASWYWLKTVPESEEIAFNRAHYVAGKPRSPCQNIGLWRSLVAHVLWEHGVAGSNPCQSDSETSHPSFGWRTIRHRRATYPKSTAMRMWCSGSTPASQGRGDRGFEPRHPLHPENQNNGSDPLMGLAAVLPWGASEKHGRTASAWHAASGTGKHAIAPVAQRKSRCLLSTGAGYRNSVGARCLVNRHA